MINHEENMKQILETQKNLASEIQELNNLLLIKKEQYIKLQGIVEYFSVNKEAEQKIVDKEE